jgi:hypothetical protein
VHTFDARLLRKFHSFFASNNVQMCPIKVQYLHASCLSSRSSEKVKFSLFGFLIAFLTTPSVAVSSGSCPNEVDICGTTPKGDTQYCLSRKEDCDERTACIDAANAAGNMTAVVECIFTYVYCTANVNAAAKEGYACDSNVTCSDRRTQDPFGIRTGPSLMQSMMAISSATGERSPIIQAEQKCVTSQCGTAPDGSKQGYMLNPADCEEVESCNVIDCQFEYLFCAEKAEIDKARLLTKYECVGNVTGATGGFVTNQTEFQICE